MVFTVIAYLIFGIFCIYCLVSAARKLKEKHSEQKLAYYYIDEKEHDQIMKQTESDEKGYFERVRNGEQTQLFLYISSLSLCNFLRSLLAAENIPTYTENEHINSLYNLNCLAGVSPFSIKVFILVADYDRAYEIIAEYVKTNKARQQIEEADKSENDVPALKTAAAVVTGMFFVNVSDGNDEKTLGITILPKLN